MSAAPNPFASAETFSATNAGASRSRAWIWWVSGLLLLATMLNYMDRQTLANLSVRITKELSLSNERYGIIEWGFGWAFAAGSLFFGFLSDRISVRFLYPGVLLAWSLIGVLTGFCEGYESMLGCRILLGFFEAGHWPCALRTTKIVLDRRNRTMGNSILQSGGALGAILTPPVILMIVGKSDTLGAWRSPFIIIGSLGFLWVIAWLFTVGANDLPSARMQDRKVSDTGNRWLVLLVGAIIVCATFYVMREQLSPWMPDGILVREFFDKHPIWITAAACLLCLAVAGASDREFFSECLTNRRFWTLIPVVVCINLTWQLIRAWLPKFLQEGRGASEDEALWFNSAYYIAADVGCIAAGAASLWLARRGLGVHRTRLLVFGTCAALTSLTIVVARLPLGWGLYGVLLIVAAGSLGLFPCYYSLSQETSEGHMGKTTGLLGAIAWLVSSPMQKEFGRVVDETHSFDQGLAWAGLAPLIALVVLFVVWPREATSSHGLEVAKP
jgi:ACS family hexuronate transporter-like MFS transporter